MKGACRYILLLMISVLISSAAHAQITFTWYNSSITVSNDNGALFNSARIDFEVRDSISQAKLIGAFIAVTDGRDTVKMLTDEFGGCLLGSKFKTDSLGVAVSYLGYKSVEGKIPNIKPIGNDLYVKILLQEDPQQLNSIIVRDHAIAMVMHGDTTIFNAAAFSSRTGDVLRDLLKKLPGVKIQDDKVVYLGEKIDRIIFNGDNMFGKDMNNAMNMVLADEVKSVKVYDKVAPDRPADDPDAKKERVMDVHTKVPLKKVDQVNISAGVGIVPSGGDSEKSNYLYGGGVSFGMYAADNAPRYSGAIEGNHNADRTASRAASSPTDNIQANIIIGRDIPGKTGWNHILIFSYDKNTQNSGNIKAFVPSMQWAERSDSSSLKAQGNTKSLQYNGTAYFLKGKNRFAVSGSIGYSKVDGLNENRAVSRVDDNISITDKLISNNSSNFNFSLDFNWSRKLNKGFRLSYRAAISGAVNNGNGERIDTSQNTMSREWLVNSLSTRSLTPAVSLFLIKNVSSDSRLSFSYKGNYNYYLDERIYTNMLTGQINLNNSTDFRQNNLTNSVTAGYKYGSAGSGLYASVDLGFKHILDLRNEKLENVSDMTRNYFRPSAVALLQYYAGESRIKLNYSESEDVPSSTQLRPVVDDVDPLYLSAGNSDLKLPVNRDISLSVSKSFAAKNIILFFSTQGTFHSNAIVSKTTYFSESTWLPEYNYTVESGSSIVLPVNVNGKIKGNVKFEFQKYIAKIKSNFTAGLSWNLDRNPFYMADVRHHNFSNTLNVNSNIRYDRGIFALYFYPSVSIGRLSLDGSKVYDYITPSLEVDTSLRLFDRLELSGEMRADKMFSTKSDAGYSNIFLTLDAAWLFGKDRRCSVKLFCSDLLNNVKNSQTSETDNYTIKSWTSGIGKAFGLNFKYVFSGR